MKRAKRTKRPAHISYFITPKGTFNGFTWSCEHPGCWRPGFECWLYLDEPGGRYCAEHAVEHGFCAGCRYFWAGVESFDFNPRGLCDNCDGEPDNPDEEEDFDWWDWGGEDDLSNQLEEYEW